MLYMAPNKVMDEMMSSSTPEQQEEMMATWNAWIETHKNAIVDEGTALGRNKRVTKEGVSDVRNEIGGYTIIKADSHEEAAKMMQDSPNFDIPGSYVEVMEVVEM